MWYWIRKYPLAAGIIVVLLIVALGSAADAWRIRKLLKAQEVLLQGQARAKERELEEAEEAWLRQLNASDRRLAPIRRERDDLKKRLAKVTAKPFSPPGSAVELSDRWRALGYRVEVGSCR
jgi:hypothetical protein